jgi:hypothetical protein
LTASEEMMFVYNGVDFTSMVPPIPSVPPVTTFYVRPDGNDNNSGFANDPADAFLTISGAVYNIGARYISQSAITIRVADGTYNDAVECSGQYIASWNIVGNSANPGNCIINATSTSQATYPPHAGLASAFTCVNGAIASVTGFTFESYFWNVGSGQGSLVITNCNFTATTTGWAPIWADEGLIQMFGNCQYSGAAPIGCIFQALLAGYIKMGEYDVLGSTPLTFYIANGANITGETALASQNGTIQTCQAVTFTGVVPNCKQYSTMTGGGIMGPGVFPGTQPGTVALPGWIS